uniref:Uncharacterized protein n=1 Tax=Eutreptiella gymnastica TaxID=73025 RepID=A0A7S4FV75_9EUGL
MGRKVSAGSHGRGRPKNKGHYPLTHDTDNKGGVLWGKGFGNPLQERTGENTVGDCGCNMPHAHADYAVHSSPAAGGRKKRGGQKGLARAIEGATCVSVLADFGQRHTTHKSANFTALRVPPLERQTASLLR